MEKSKLLSGIPNIEHGFYNKFDSAEVVNPVFMKQVHSADVLAVDGETMTPQQVDAMATVESGINLTIKTADCGPILFADGTHGVIGVAHAGWKGAFQGVMEKTVLAMIELGAKIADIVVAIGPCLHKESFEVQEEFKSLFPVTEERFFIREDGKIYFDFVPYLIYRLKAIGITKIDVIDIDTYTNEDYFSYRKDPENPGRQYSSIKLIL